MGNARDLGTSAALAQVIAAGGPELAQIMLDAIPVGAALITAYGEVEAVNQQLRDYFGLSLDELKRWAITAFLHPDDIQRFERAHQRSIATEEPFANEQRHRRFDGVYRWFEVRALPIRDAQGHIAHWSVIHVDIDDLKRAEEALTKRAREARLVLDNVGGHIAIVSPNNELLDLNQQGIAYIGKPFEELKGLKPADYVHPDDLRVLAESSLGRGFLGSPYAFEARLRRFDGVYRWFSIRSFPLQDDTGQIVRWYLLATDIEDRKRAEEAARENEAYLKLLFDTLPVGVAVTTPTGATETINRQMLEYFGIERQVARRPRDTIDPDELEALVDTVVDEELKKWQITDWIHPDDLAASAEVYKRHLVAGEGFGHMFRIRAPDGSYRWFDSRSRPQKDDKGIVRWCMTLFDIDDRVRAQIDLKRAYDSIAHAQQLSKTGSFSSDILADIHTWSDETYRIFEFDIGSKITADRMRARVLAEDVPTFDAMLQRAGAGNEVTFDFRIVAPSGAMKYISGMARVADTVDGRPVFVGALRDVTERRAAEVALDTVRSELAQASRMTSLGALTASIAHEINQPLMGIVTNASTCLKWLSMNPPNIEGARETAKRSIRDGHRAVDVISRLRNLFQRGKAALGAVDLTDATGEVIALSQADLGRHRVTLHVALKKDLPTITGDRVQLQQVMQNLLRNAVDAMSAVEGRPRRLAVSTARENDGVVFSVEDSGVGISAGDLERIFDPFFTTKPEGMGIGLSLSRSIIQSHGGRLWANSKEGLGTTFSFSIPLGGPSAGAIDISLEKHPTEV